MKLCLVKYDSATGPRQAVVAADSKDDAYDVLPHAHWYSKFLVVEWIGESDTEEMRVVLDAPV